MIETIKFIVEIWKDYWGAGYFQYLLVAAGLYLLIRHKKIRSAVILVMYLAIGLFFFWLPFTAMIIQKCIGSDVYWRYLWVLPTIPIIACALTELCMRLKFKIVRLGVVLVMLVLIGFCGKPIWFGDIYTEVQNEEKVPQYVADICDIILKDAGKKQIMLAAGEEIVTYARVYNPAIQTRYGREARGAETIQDLRLYRILSDPDWFFQGKRLKRLAKKCKINYMVIQLSDPENQNLYLESHGFKKLGQVNEYTVYKRKRKK